MHSDPLRLTVRTAIIVVWLTTHVLAADPSVNKTPTQASNPAQNPDSPVVQAVAITAIEQPPTLRPIDFPRLADIRYTGTVDAYLSPASNLPQKWHVGVVRLLFVFSMMFIWLRELMLCNYADREQPSKHWFFRLFMVGLGGCILALLVPAYVPIVGVLLVTNVLPFWLYKRVRNSAAETNLKLRWRDLFVLPLETQWHDTSIKFEPLFVGELETSQVADTSQIKLIEKSTSAPNILWDHLDDGQKSRGYELARSLISHAVASNATDLHVSTKNDHVIAQQRIDGSIRSLADLPLELGKSVINVFKVMSDLNIANRRKSQDGSFSVDVNGRRLSFRVCSQGTEGGEKLSIRILDPATTFADFTSLGMPVEMQERFNAEVNRKHGLVLVVGATGAGKSTTACAALRAIDTKERNIVSIEAPIEYRIPTVDQIEVNTRANQTFDSALRSVLRLDADVIFIGEIRDEETARIACRASMTGQLVLATLHANNAVSGALRMGELGVDLQNVASSLRAVLSQTLVRTLCVDCRVPYRLDPQKLQDLEARGLHGLDGELFRSPQNGDVPCPKCNGVGFLRRTGVFEFLSITPAIRDLIQDQARPSTILSVARENGMATLNEEGLRLVREGKISLDEFLRIFDIP